VGLRAGQDGRGKYRPTGIQSLGRPARSKSLYRLRYVVKKYKPIIPRPLRLPMDIRVGPQPETKIIHIEAHKVITGSIHETRHNSCVTRSRLPIMVLTCKFQVDTFMYWMQTFLVTKGRACILFCIMA